MSLVKNAPGEIVKPRGLDQLNELNEFLENASLGIQAIDGRGNILWANREILKTLGYGKDEYEGREMRSFHADYDTVVEMLKRLKVNEPLVNYPIYLKCKNGSSKLVLFNSSSRFQDGEFSYALCFLHEPSDGESIGMCAEARMKKLEEINKDLLNFVTIAYQDLREPLRGINNFSTFLLEDYAEILGEDGQAKLSALANLSSRVESFIDALLYFSMLSSSEYPASRISLSEVIYEAMDMVKGKYPTREISCSVGAGLPILCSNKELLGMIFESILENAVLYNDNERVEIEVGVKPEEEAAVIYVKDNGIGISEKNSKRVFNVFKRLHLKGVYGEGIGVGLSNAKKVAELHDGSIWIESEEGKGSTIFVSLKNLDVN